MMAELLRRPLRRKSRVTVQSQNHQITSNEEPVRTTTEQLDRQTDLRNPPSRQITTLPTTTTQFRFPSRRRSETKQQITEKIERGRQEAARGEYARAIAIFDRIVPATFDSLYYRGCARLQLGQQTHISDAIEDFDQALIFTHTQTDPNIYYKRAFACQLIGRYAEALVDYSMFINKSSSKVTHKGYLSRGLVYNEMKQYEKALEDIRQANQLNPETSKYYVYCLARAEASVGNHNEAQAKFHELKVACDKECQRQGQSFDSLFYYGIALYELNEYSNALTLFNEAFQCSRNNSQRADAKFYVSLTYYALEDIENAEKELREVLSYDPNHSRALFRLGLIESRNKNSSTNALTYLTKAHQLTPHKSDILYERGELYHKLGQLDACVRDKRLALQAERTEPDQSAMKHYYELLLQRLLSTMKQQGISPELNLILALLYDKLHILSQHVSRLSIFDKDYRQLTLIYEREIDKDENGIYSPIYFALLSNLHQHHKHPAAAMIALDQLHHTLDINPHLEQHWNQLLNDIREMAKKQNVSPSESIQNLLQITFNQPATSTENEQKNSMLIKLLQDKMEELERIERNRNQVKLDQESFREDPNRNRLDFYHKMRVLLSHKFTSMAVVSGDDDNEPIVKHDRTGTETLIAQGVSMLGDAVGASMPTGGGVISGLSKFLGTQLQKHEYNRFQNRMAVITDVGTIEELTDVARRVARQLADRYREQLLSLKRRTEEVPEWYLSCSPCLRRCKKKSLAKIVQPVEQIAQFGVAFVVQAIIDGEMERFSINDDNKCEDLAHAIAELISSAKPNMQKKVFQRLGIEQNAVLAYIPIPDLQQGETLKKWLLYDFYRKPGIWILDGEGVLPLKKLTWMEPESYHYRLGTQEEHDYLEKLDEKENENKTKSRCCCC